MEFNEERPRYLRRYEFHLHQRRDRLVFGMEHDFDIVVRRAERKSVGGLRRCRAGGEEKKPQDGEQSIVFEQEGPLAKKQ